MLREFLVLSYLSHLNILPRVLAFHLGRREMVLSYLPGERVLEWVLRRYGDPALDLETFKSVHGLESNPTVDRAFHRFRESQDQESVELKTAIKASYRLLHGKGFVHGDPSPRNLIFNGRAVYLVDFDHSRPSLDPAAVDFKALRRWYGLERD